MKMHHFALLFSIIMVGCLVSAQTVLVIRLQRERLERIEYDCLVAAVNAVTEEIFQTWDNTVTEEELNQAEEVFFQTLSVLRNGTTEQASWMTIREYIPCLVVFEERGYYRYSFEPETGYCWSELRTYENGTVSEDFFIETEDLLKQYHNLRFTSEKEYRMEQAGRGVWEQSIAPPCVFAIYAPQSMGVPGDRVGFLYAAAGKRYEVYYVTEDNKCHAAFCNQLEMEKIVARYSTQKKSAEDGAVPCEFCLR